MVRVWIAAVAEADLDSLESLLDKSLVRHRVGMIGEDRYWMLETIREFAQRELEREGEADEAHSRHSAFFATLADGLHAIDPLVVTDEERSLVASERANFGEALARAVSIGDGATALRLVRRLGPVRSVIGIGARDWYPRAVASLALPGIGLSLCGRGEVGPGIRLVSATRHMWRVAGVGVPEEPFMQAVVGRVDTSARTASGDGYEAAVKAGEALTRDEAIALGLSVDSQEACVRTSGDGPPPRS